MQRVQPHDTPRLRAVAQRQVAAALVTALSQVFMYSVGCWMDVGENTSPLI